MAAVVSSMDQAELRRQIVAIQTNSSLSDAEKAQKRQALLSGSWQPVVDKQKEGSHLCLISSFLQFLFFSSNQQHFVQDRNQLLPNIADQMIF